MGGLCLLVSLPAWALLALGRLIEGRDPFRLLPLLAVAPGALLLLFGTGRLPRTGLSDVGVRVAGIGLAFVLFLFLFLGIVALGVEPFMTSVRFCAMAASYLGLLATALLVAAAFRGRRLDSPSPPP